MTRRRRQRTQLFSLLLLVWTIAKGNISSWTASSFVLPLTQRKSLPSSPSGSTLPTAIKTQQAPHWQCSWQQQQRGRTLVSIEATTSSDFTTTEALEKMTVKELKVLLKEANLQERGLLSKLKRKQDLVHYLEKHLPLPSTTTTTTTAATSPKPSSSIIPKTQSPEGNPAENDSSLLTEEGDVVESATKMHPKPQQNPSTPTKQDQRPRSSPMPRLSFLDAFYESIYRRYPPLRRTLVPKTKEPKEADGANDDDNNENGADEEDIRQIYHPLVRNCSTSDMDLVFVGTASCTPGITRSVSCTALRLNWSRRTKPQDVSSSEQERQTQQSSFTGGTWLFDAGECTQLQVQKTGRVRPTKITKIFITHSHGDHSFGLPGMMCLIGQDRDRGGPPLEIYGPKGLRKWLRVAIRYSVSRIVPPYRVHELMDIPMAPEWRRSRNGKFHYRRQRQGESRYWTRPQQDEHGDLTADNDPESWMYLSGTINMEASRNFGEIDGGRDIYPQYDHPQSVDGAPVWEVEDEDDVRVYAAPMSHSVPCVGYVVQEKSRPGRLRNEIVEPIVRRNIQALKDAGFKIPMKAMGVIKNMQPGSTFTFPDGTTISQEEAVEPPRKGRKVVICGDTCDARAISGLAMDADVVIHEATNAFLKGIDRQTDLREVTRDAVVHGHSTPQLAAQFAKSVRANKLLLNHFSARYKGDASVESISAMTRIEQQAINAGDLDETRVAATWDCMEVPIPQK